MVCKRMSVRAVVLMASVLMSQNAFAIPSAADPSDDPCSLAVTFFCRFVPMAPDLVGDVDLTKQLPPADPAAPAPDSLPPADLCARGCS